MDAIQFNGAHLLIVATAIAVGLLVGIGLGAMLAAESEGGAK